MSGNHRGYPMNLRHFVRNKASIASGLALAMALCAPALAQDHAMPMPPPPGAVAAPGPWAAPRAPQPYAVDPQMRAGWIAECHRRMGSGRDDRWDGDRGHRRDRDRDRAGPVDDGCESYFDGYYAHHNAVAAAGPGNYGSYGYAQGCCQAAPMMMAPQAAPECRETVEYEYVDAPARRVVPPRRTYRRVVPDKRIRVVPDKRIRVY
jgi:hypothetical protein